MDSLNLHSTYYIFLLILVILCAKLLTKCMIFAHKYQLLKKIPSPRSNLLLGHLNLLFNEQNRLPNKSITQAYFNLIDKLGIIYQTGHVDTHQLDVTFSEPVVKKSSLFKINLTPFRPVVHVVSADAAEIILTNSVLLDKPFQYKLLRNWLGNALLTSSGNNWREQRKLISKVFHNQVVKRFSKIINRHAVNLSRQLLSNSKSRELLDDPLRRETSTDERLLVKLNQSHQLNHCHEHWLLRLLINCSLDIILHTVIGSPINPSDHVDTKCQYIEALREYCTLFIQRISTPWMWSDFVYNASSAGVKAKRIIRTMKKYTNHMIESKISQVIYAKHNDVDTSIPSDEEFAREDSTERKSLLDLLVAHHLLDKRFTVDHLANQIDTFVFAGHDTVSLRHAHVKLQFFWSLQSNSKLL